MASSEERAEEITLSGIVQGVGFRPFVYRLALRLGLTGTVRNAGGRVVIHVAGPGCALDAFAIALEAEAPPLARIAELARAAAPMPVETSFRIVESGAGTVSVGVVPDVATCPACRAEIADPAARRFRYAFTNCTDCGPRFSIVTGLPYDRPATTMAGFALCPACRAEYEHPADRRFHAQPIACPTCGPRLWLEPLGQSPADKGARPAETPSAGCDLAVARDAAARAEPPEQPPRADPSTAPAGALQGFMETLKRSSLLTDRMFFTRTGGRFARKCSSASDAAAPPTVRRPEPTPLGAAPEADPIAAAAALLRAGSIVAVKGIGGFHLACDATNAGAVAELRRRKRRPTKPLAVMADRATAARVAAVGPAEAAALEGPSAPIVLLRLHPASDAESSGRPNHPDAKPEARSGERPLTSAHDHPRHADASAIHGHAAGFEPLPAARSMPRDDRPPLPNRPSATPPGSSAETPRRAGLTPAGAGAAPGTEPGAPEPLTPGIAPGQRHVGVMLPYTPLHHLLLEATGRPLVMTSGNGSGAPQVIDNAEARRALAGIADAMLTHDRPIARRLDDSVVRIAAGAARVMRRGRGLAPMPMALPADFAAAPPVLALGAEMKSAICLTHGGSVLLSHHLGDLEEPGTIDAFEAAIADYSALFAHAPAAIALDLHPGYHATRHGLALAEARGLPVQRVQHHHAHMAAAMAEAGWCRADGAVVGLILDGLGLGDDGTIWGGEILVGDYISARRAGRLAPIPLIGGDAASREPWRVLLAHLDRALGRNVVDRAPALRARFAGKPVATLRAMADKGLNAPPGSSAGRLFDAMAALLGLAPDRLSHEGEAAMALEAAALDAPEVEPYPLALTPGALLEIDPAPLWRAALGDLEAGRPAAAMAAAFHEGLALAFADAVAQVAQRERLNAVALSGGVMQNPRLLEALVARLAAHGLRTLVPAEAPANDGGLALGQAAAAAARLLA